MHRRRIRAPRRVLACRFELPVAQFVGRLTAVRRALDTAADERLLLVDTCAMASLCQSLLGLGDASRVALVVVHHVRKSIGRHEIDTSFRASSVLHAVGDSCVLLTRRLRNRLPWNCCFSSAMPRYSPHAYWN